MASEFLRYPYNLGQPPFDKWIKFNVMTGRHVLRSKPVVEQNQPDRALKSVGLYLPNGALKSTLELTYDTNELGPFIGAAVELLAQGGGNVVGLKNGGSGLQGIQSNLTRLVGAVGEQLTNSDSFKGILEALALKFTSGLAGTASRYLEEDVSPAAAASAAFGIKANPRTETLFNTQQFRTHSMEFMLIPRTLDEAKAIDDILYFFQFYSLPRYSTQTDNFKLGAFMVGFPYEFTVEMLAAKGSTNVSMTHVNKIGRSVLTSVDFDHAAGGKTAFVKNNGEYFPVATSLRLQFREVRLLARGDDEIKRTATDTIEGEATEGPTLDGLPDPLA
jgi:hypothetical protein